MNTAAALLVLSACVGDGPTATTVGKEANGSSVTVSLGESLDVILGTVGPGLYVSPPDVTGAAVLFLAADIVPPYNPGGPTQRFRFRAAALGTSHVAVSKFDRAGSLQPSAYVLDVVVR